MFITGQIRRADIGALRGWSPTLSSLVSAPGYGFSEVFRRATFPVPVTVGTKKAFINLTKLVVTLSLQSVNDGGEAAAVSSDASGTWVTFNKSFIAVDYITLTPRHGNTAVRWDYDLPAGANPTGFWLWAWDGSNNRVSGSFSWSAGGK